MEVKLGLDQNQGTNLMSLLMIRNTWLMEGKNGGKKRWTHKNLSCETEDWKKNVEMIMNTQICSKITSKVIYLDKNNQCVYMNLRESQHKDSNWPTPDRNLLTFHQTHLLILPFSVYHKLKAAALVKNQEPQKEQQRKLHFSRLFRLTHSFFSTKQWREEN